MWGPLQWTCCQLFATQFYVPQAGCVKVVSGFTHNSASLIHNYLTGQSQRVKIGYDVGYDVGFNGGPEGKAPGSPKTFGRTEA